MKGVHKDHQPLLFTNDPEQLVGRLPLPTVTGTLLVLVWATGLVPRLIRHERHSCGETRSSKTIIQPNNLTYILVSAC